MAVPGSVWSQGEPSLQPGLQVARVSALHPYHDCGGRESRPLERNEQVRRRVRHPYQTAERREKEESMIIPLILISAFLAVNMGVSGFAVSFTPSYGSGILKKRDAVILYAIFVFAGGILVGPRVVETLVGKISLQRIGTASSLIIIVSATIMMTLSNLLKIPQSTSFVAVAAFVGAGLFHGAVNWQTVIRIIRVAALFSAASFALTYWLARGG